VLLRFNQLPNIYALIIGISEYASPEVHNLRFAAQDADKFERFLVNNLNVPHSHIINLRNETATRIAIINAFTTLLDDVRIVKADDPAIIIYFAGHGASVDKPEEWHDWASNTGKVELLSPTDINTVQVTSSGEEQVVQGIPDRTISVLLNHLSDAKGNNVVGSDVAAHNCFSVLTPTRRLSFWTAVVRPASVALTSKIRTLVMGSFPVKYGTFLLSIQT
jgi:hypothetical protein